MAQRELRLLIGPTNTVGQGSSWAAAVQTRLGIPTEVWKASLPEKTYPYRVDRMIQPEIPEERERSVLVDDIAKRFTHVINESGQPFGSARSMRRVIQDAYSRRLRGVRTALLFHGSDIRLPSIHLAENPDSPFRHSNDGLTEKLERLVSARRTRLAFWVGTTFITTLDLHRYVGRATWLPVAIDPSWFMPARSIDSEAARPKLLHMWTRREFSHSDVIDQVCSRLHDSGLVEYRSVSGISPDKVREQIIWADVVVDKVGFGATGVFAAEALASGRIVVGDIGARARTILPEHPVIDATTSTLDGLLRDLVADRSGWAAQAAAGEAFARRYHDGRYSAAVLAEWMGVPVKQP